MEYRLRRLSILKSGVFSAIGSGLLSLVITVPMVILMGVVAAVDDSPETMFLLVIYLFMPVLYAIFGFIFGILGAWIYNLMAGWMGGIKWTLDPVPPGDTSW